jgi:hypothetical protein
MANENYDPNARYDHGPNAATGGRVSEQSVLAAGADYGLASDGALVHAESRVGFGAAGALRDNTGGNVAGAPRSINNT